MLPRHENELLTRIGPGTPMGRTMRRYWMPALPVERDRRARLPAGAGARCWARTSSPSATATAASASSTSSARTGGVVVVFRAQRGMRAALRLSRLEIRHRRQLLDQLNEPAEHQFKHKIHITAYPTVELGGVVWAYLGPPDKIPAPPEIRLDAGARERTATSPR